MAHREDKEYSNSLMGIIYRGQKKRDDNSEMDRMRTRTIVKN